MIGSARELLDRFPKAGRLDWIGLRQRREAPMQAVERAELIANRGIAGDRYANDAHPGKRQVSLMQAEHVGVIAGLLGQRAIDVALLRRNLVVSGINLQALRHARFRIGRTLLEGVDDCHPCSKIELALGPGGYNAMRGHGGILARVLEGGPIEPGDTVRYAGAPLPDQVLGAPLRVQRVPTCPELELCLVDGNADLEGPVQAAWHQDPLPFWAFCWGAGAALARHVLDHPDLVRGARVVDFGAGSGVAAIAAIHAGAAEVIAVDVDPQARAACLANAALNQATLTTPSALPEAWDLLIAGDVLYQGADNLAQLQSWVRAGRRVLLAVPERPGVPELPWTALTRVQVNTFPDVDTPTRNVRVFMLD
jgi:predicted nicotinamide N-methyase/MOSC domain-containing protein YiiM